MAENVINRTASWMGQNLTKLKSASNPATQNGLERNRILCLYMIENNQDSPEESVVWVVLLDSLTGTSRSSGSVSERIPTMFDDLRCYCELGFFRGTSRKNLSTKMAYPLR